MFHIINKLCAFPAAITEKSERAPVRVGWCGRTRYLMALPGSHRFRRSLPAGILPDYNLQIGERLASDAVDNLTPQGVAFS